MSPPQNRHILGNAVTETILSDYTLYPPDYDPAEFAAAHAKFKAEFEAQPSVIALRERVAKTERELREKFGDNATALILATINDAVKKSIDAAYSFTSVEGGLGDLIK